MRWPTTHYSDATPQLGKWQNEYSKNANSRQQDVHSAFQWSDSFQNFSEILENAHSDIHLGTGGSESSNGYVMHGHMYGILNSAFDPVFMLHHA